MKKQLALAIGQFSIAGRKPVNQDFHAAFIPGQPLLNTKGIVVALADGISSSDVSQHASETAVKSFISDYYCTSDSWSVKNSAQRVLKATNSWLHSQTQQSPYRFDKNKGYVCTFSALVFKSNTAYLFHVGDSRIYRISSGNLEQLSNDHRTILSEEVSYLSKGLGIKENLDVDYNAFPLEEGEMFIIATDGVYEFLSASELLRACSSAGEDLDLLARQLTETACNAGSEDNLTIQIVRVEQLPERNLHEVQEQINLLPPAPTLQPGKIFEDYLILRELHISSRSHIYLAQDKESGAQVVIKTPSTEMRTNERYLEQFLMEDWVARRLHNLHVVKAAGTDRARKFIYTITEFIEGKTLAQWMIDNSSPSLEQVRKIVDQIARGLQAFHRQEMIHQDLRPNNIMIDEMGTVKIIDFGSTKISGVQEITEADQEIAGTAQYTAPEYFLGAEGSSQSDIFSLGVITYQLLSGRLPYGNDIAKTQSVRDQRRLNYSSVITGDNNIPRWVDFAIKKACAIRPENRYREVAEFVYELKHPNPTYLSNSRPPILERNPVLFWQIVSLLLFCALIYKSVQ